MRTKLCVIINSSGNPFAESVILGLTVRSHLLKGLGALPVAESLNQANGYDYAAVVYDDMPVVTEDFLINAAQAAKMRNAEVMALGRGLIGKPSALLKGTAPNHVFECEDALSVTDCASLAAACCRLQKRTLCALLEQGVIIPKPDCVAVDATVEIGKDAYIAPFVELKGNTKIGERAKILSFTRVEDGEIGAETVVEGGVIQGAVIGKRCKIGPFCVIRPLSAVGDECRVGDFVELKAARLGDNVKCAHLAYVGDAEVGNRTNIGCGAVFANYNGREKRKITVANDVFIGCNVNLVAPLTVEDNCFIAAATTVTEDLAGNSFAIGRTDTAVSPRRGKPTANN